jgi:hypothetical protein
MWEKGLGALDRKARQTNPITGSAPIQTNPIGGSAPPASPLSLLGDNTLTSVACLALATGFASLFRRPGCAIAGSACAAA